MKSGESDIFDLFEAGLKGYISESLMPALPKSESYWMQFEKHLKKIVVHRFPELLNDFFGGYHHYARESLIKNSGNYQPFASLCLGELNNISEPLTTVFGPVYESISKKGYVPKVSMPELGATLHT